MGSSFNKKYLSFLFFCLLVFFLTACTNVTPDIKKAKLTVIFDYSHNEATPTARMGVFVESTENPYRFESIKIIPQNQDYVWMTSDIVTAEVDETKYCGITNLRMPGKENFVEGDYKLVYQQADMKAGELQTNLKYIKDFYTTIGKDVPDVMKKNRGERYISIYDEDNTVIYYGLRGSNLSDARNIWVEYNNAKTFQDVWVSGNGTTMCVMPIEQVRPGN